MVRTQVYLTDKQKRSLEAISRRTRHSQSELIREAIDRLVDSEARETRLQRMRAACGIWKDRDPSEFAAVRKTLDRFPLPDGRGPE